MSAADRAAVAAAQKARWAKINGNVSSKKAAVPAKATVKTEPKKKGMSAETKAKLAAAMKSRWAAKRKSATT